MDLAESYSVSSSNGKSGNQSSIVSVVMVWEFPAVSQSRIEFWSNPQFTQSGMWWFTLVFGMFGLHHLYLRSPQTALMFLIGNFISLGYLWAYDMVQLSSSGGYTTETLNKHGLAHPWGAMGLAQGMWVDPEDLDDKGEAPNPLWFVLYALLIPCAPLAQMIAGDTNNAVSRFADLTIIPLGFLFYLCAMLYDYWILFSNPADLLVAGSKRFFPFTYLGMDADGHSARLTGNSEIKPCPPDTIFKTIIRMIIPILSYFFPGIGKSISAALDAKDDIVTAVTTAKEVVVDKGLAKVAQVTNAAAQVGSLSSGLASGVGSSVANATAKLSNPGFASTIGTLAPTPVVAVPTLPSLPAAPVPTLPTVPSVLEVTGAAAPQGMVPSTNGKSQFINPTTGQGYGTMVGGARLESGRSARSARSEKSKENTFNTLDYTALGALGAVIGGGLLLSASRNVGSKNDTPPNTRAV